MRDLQSSWPLQMRSGSPASLWLLMADLQHSELKVEVVSRKIHFQITRLLWLFCFSQCRFLQQALMSRTTVDQSLVYIQFGIVVHSTITSFQVSLPFYITIRYPTSLQHSAQFSQCYRSYCSSLLYLHVSILSKAFPQQRVTARNTTSRHPIACLLPQSSESIPYHENTTCL